jgi:hypothetical protein
VNIKKAQKTCWRLYVLNLCMFVIAHIWQLPRHNVVCMDTCGILVFSTVRENQKRTRLTFEYQRFPNIYNKYNPRHSFFFIFLCIDAHRCRDNVNIKKAQKTCWRLYVLNLCMFVIALRDRPFNLQGGMVFCFVQNFFFGQIEWFPNIYNKYNPRHSFFFIFLCIDAHRCRDN